MMARSRLQETIRSLTGAVGVVLLGLSLPMSGAAQDPAARPAKEEPCFALRYNPPSCGECPPFELQQGAQWSRVYLLDRSEDGDLLAKLEAAGKQAGRQEEDLTWMVTLRVTERVKRCLLGHPHLVVELRSACSPPGDVAPLRESTPTTAGTEPWVSSSNGDLLL